MAGAWEGVLRSRFTSTAGGVMTEEAGAVTGELELLTRPVGDAVEVLVRYAGAEEWYTVTGAPVRASAATPEADRGGHERGHEAIRARLTTPGRVDEGGNELPVDIRDQREAVLREAHEREGLGVTVGHPPDHRR